MKAKLALNTLIWFGLLTCLSGAVVYLDPELLNSWVGPALLAGPPVAGVLFFLTAPKGERVPTEVKVQPQEVKKEKVPSPEPKSGEKAPPSEAAKPAVTPQEPQQPAWPPPEVTVAQVLGLLQREGRLLDFLKEDIEPYDDAQIGAAVREVHRGCRAALEEILGLEPVIQAEEGTVIEVDEDFDPTKIRLVGNVHGKPPFKGILRHSGWRFTRIRLPKWTGKKPTDVLSPAEVEIS